MQAESTTSEPEEGGGAVLELPSILDTLAAEELLTALRGCGPGGVALDAAAVERVSTGAVQILLTASCREAKRDTLAALPDRDLAADPDVVWLKALLDRFTLSELRQRFAAKLLAGTAAEGYGAAAVVPAGGDIELF